MIRISVEIERHILSHGSLVGVLAFAVDLAHDSVVLVESGEAHQEVSYEPECVNIEGACSVGIGRDHDSIPCISTDLGHDAQPEEYEGGAQYTLGALIKE